MTHPDTIGTVEWDGLTYEIDWPFQIDNPEERDIFAAVYLDGDQVGEFANPNFPFGQGFNNEDHVLSLAFEFIATGALEE